MGLPRVTLHLSKYQDVYREIESADLSDEATMIRINIMIEVLWVLYSKDKELNDLYKNGHNVIEDRTIDFWLKTALGKLKDQFLTHAFAHKHNIQTMANRKLDIRTRLLLDTKHYTELSDEQIQNYENTWVKTDLVQITNKALVTAPFRREPP